MAVENPPVVEWVVLTTGSRPDAVREALRSLDGSPRCLVANGGGADVARGFDGVRVIEPSANVGIPAGRDLAARSSDCDVVAFLDDDAVAPHGIDAAVVEAFSADDRLGAVTFRLVDEDGATAGWHVPRPGGRGAKQSGEVALVLGGACAIRSDAYEAVGGYWIELFYGHEEVELCWRLVDRGWRIRYLADVTVFHPRTVISRHAEGWRLTGRNRVLIARRTLPWLVAIIHTAIWLVIGTLRAARERQARAYVRGWLSGWRRPIDRRPIAWRTVWRLTRLGRPPLI